jgi:ABC-type Fe3+/spermidine/putrescine transport system ATPase subunit
MAELKIENLTSGYQGKPIIKKLLLEAFPLETMVLMGPSGSGKTTLLLTILGIVTSFEGKVILNGSDISKVPIEDRNIGYLPQDYGLFPHMNVQENVAFGLRVRGMVRDEREKKALQMLQLVNLIGFEKRKIDELSGGERQRVGLARALAVDPALLLLDEPLSNIDQVTKHEVAKQLKQLFRKLKIPIILVTHNHEDAIFLADKLAILINGAIEQVGTLNEVLEHPKSEFIKRLLSPFSS